jgi:NAD(P)H dehydrogenase (quinone)
MINVAVIYFSRYGHTEALAKSVAKGVGSVEGVTLHLLTAEEAQKNLDLLNMVDGMIFGSPTYMGSLSAGLKSFFETTSHLWMEQKWRNKIAAGFTNSGSQHGDKLCTLFQMTLFAMQHGMVWVGLDLLPGYNSSTGGPTDLNRLGCWLGVMSQSNVDQGPDAVPPESDHKTAEYLGKRVAEATKQWARGKTG